MKDDENPELEKMGIGADEEDAEPEVLMDDVEVVQSNEDGDVADGAHKIKQLKDKIKLLEKEKTEYLDGWQRARADYSNLVKTSEEDKKRLREVFKESFVADFIPVVDSFQMAMGNSEAWEKVDANWRTGVEYIYNQLISALASHGLELFGAVGDSFDPARYEAVSEETTDEQTKDHTIAKVIQKGFLLGNTVIRPARVTVYTTK